MKILVVKMSSLGDVVHCLPAISDAQQALQNISIDFLVEKNFAEIPSWHSGIDQVIPIEFRKWRQHPFTAFRKKYWQTLLKRLRQQYYDLIIDAQGLLKSALLAQMAKGAIAGFNFASAREPLASLFYQHKYAVAKNQHAIWRLRQLFSQALHYKILDQQLNYGVDARQFPCVMHDKYIVFLPATTWVSKMWPQVYWIELGQLLAEQGYQIKIAWGNETEKQYAQTIIDQVATASLIEKTSLQGLASYLAHAQAIVAVDTGLGHISAALSTSCLSIYGATDVTRTGTQGSKQDHLSSQFVCSPCLQRQCQYPQKEAIYPPCYREITPSRLMAILSTTALKNKIV